MEVPLNLPRGLITDLRSGRVLLFLGAGASIGARDPHGRGPLLGEELRDLLVGEYLTPSLGTRSLASVAELAISERSLPEIQDFVASHFKDLEPAEFHLALTTFKWRAIVTTNFDRVVEKAYARNEGRAQELIPILSNEDRVDEKLRGDSTVALLKLHGCVTITQREDLPLILTVDQYGTHRDNRGSLFDRFEGWAGEYPVLFVGHSLEDPDIREVLNRLSKSTAMRPRYFLLSPDVSDIETRFWESKKITTLNGSLEKLVAALEREIPLAVRPLIKHVEVDHPIRRLFVVDEELPPNVAAMLTHDLEFVHEGLPPEAGSPQAFYRGFGLGWYPIQSGLDVRRRLTDTLLTDVIIRLEEDRPSVAELYMIDAAAGAGKSVLLRRLAWEAGTEADVISLYVRPFGNPGPDELSELCRLTGRRLFLHWDDAASNVASLRRLISYAKQKRVPITVISAERINEWNMSCVSLAPFVSDRFELHRLSEAEIRALVRLLEDHDCLGPHLKDKSEDERIHEFVRVAGRHLIVALHEATRGPPLADILEDEYSRIRPTKARQLYLTVCVLNRLRTPVRAGLISRVHDIPFEQFKEELFSPLDHVVEARPRSGTGDYYYQARHPEIAQIVFTRILSDRDDRLNEYLRIIGNLNLAFDSDRDSFRGVTRARALHELFPDYQDVRAIFSRAEEVGSREAYLYQQRANYERIRPDGNLDDAEAFLTEARELDPRDESINHTLAEVFRERGKSGGSALTRQRHRDQARAILVNILASRGSDEYARVTLVKVEIDQLQDVLEQEDATDREIDDAIRTVERQLGEALQQHPDEEYLLTAEADFSKLISDNDRSLKALEKASKANPRDPYIANRLARALVRRGNIEAGKDTLRSALDSNIGDMRLNFQYAEMLRRVGEDDCDILAHYYERAFTPGDRNYEAQFWFARFAFESTDTRLRTKSKVTFQHLRNASMSHARRVEIKDLIGGRDEPKIWWGTVERVEQTYGKIRRDGLGDLIFTHANNVKAEVWSSLGMGVRVCFALGFCFSGPGAVNVELPT